MRLTMEAHWRVANRVRSKRRQLLWWNRKAGASAIRDSHKLRPRLAHRRCNLYWSGSRLPDGWRASWLVTIAVRCRRTSTPGRSGCEPCLARSTGPSPRLWTCIWAAYQGQLRRSLCKTVSQRLTPEFEYLQAKGQPTCPAVGTLSYFAVFFAGQRDVAFRSVAQRVKYKWHAARVYSPSR